MSEVLVPRVDLFKGRHQAGKRWFRRQRSHETMNIANESSQGPETINSDPKFDYVQMRRLEEATFIAWLLGPSELMRFSGWKPLGKASRQH